MSEVLLTGAFGRVGTAVIEHLGDEHSFRYLDREPHPDHESVVADVTDREAIRPAFEGRDAVVHLAGYPSTDATWEQALRNNVVGTRNALAAAREAGVESFVFASSNHVVGNYETEHAPEIYDPGHGLVLDHATPPRPDSFYGTSKLFGEALGRQYVETREYPKRFYALRIGSVRAPEYDHPYGDAERGVDAGEFDRGDDAYDRQVRRLSATWQSRRDLARQVGACLADDDVTFGVFYGVSDNLGRWFDLERARALLSYRPVDSAEAYDGPPD